MPDTTALFHRALRADHRIAVLDRMVSAFEKLAPTHATDAEFDAGEEVRMCSACIWDTILKPLATQVLGWGRGDIPEQAKDEEPDELRLYTVTELLAMKPNETPAETDTEKWLRTSEAWDAVTSVWVTRLHWADPANGHGIGRRRPYASDETDDARQR